MGDRIGSIDEVLRGSGIPSSFLSDAQATRGDAGEISASSSTETPPDTRAPGAGEESRVDLSEELQEQQKPGNDEHKGGIGALLSGLNSPSPSNEEKDGLGALNRELNNYLGGKEAGQSRGNASSSQEPHKTAPHQQNAHSAVQKQDGSSSLSGQMKQKLASLQNQLASQDKAVFSPHINKGDEVKEGRVIGKVDADFKALESATSQMGLNGEDLSDARETILKQAKDDVEKRLGNPVNVSSNGTMTATKAMKAQSLDSISFDLPAGALGKGSSSPSSGGAGGGAAQAPAAPSESQSSSSSGSGSSPSSEEGGDSAKEGQDKNSSTPNEEGAGKSAASPGQSPQTMSAKQKEKAVSEITRDPEKILREGGISLDEGAEGDSSTSDKKEDGKLAFIPFDAAAKLNPDSSVREGDIVKGGQKLAKVDVDAKGLEEFSFKEAVMGLLTKSVGDGADLEKDGTVTARSTRKIESIAGNENLTEGRALIKEKDLDVSNPFEVYMEKQEGNEAQKAGDYLSKNDNTRDSGWVKERLGALQNGPAEMKQSSSQDGTLLKEYKSLWRDEYSDRNQKPGETHIFTGNS
jgi:hypothetical protein